MPDALAGTSDASVPSGRSSAAALLLAGTAAVLASSCCVAPLLLALAGLSGAWLSRLHWLAPYSPALVAMAVVSLAWAGWKLFRSSATQGVICGAAGDCAAGYCVNATVQTRRWFWLVLLLTLVPLVVPLVAPWFY